MVLSGDPFTASRRTQHPGFYVVRLTGESSGQQIPGKTGVMWDSKVMWVTAIAVHQNGRIFAASSGLYMSTDNGQSWSELITTNGDYFTSIVINSSGHIFAAGTGPGVYRSTNNGNNWTEINNGLVSAAIFQMAVNDDDDLYLCTDYLPGTSVYRSTDNGNNWVSIGPAGTFGTSIIITGEGNIFLGSILPSGIYLSTNDGATWNTVNTGLPSFFRPHTFSLSNNGTVYLGTDRGVFSTTNEGGSWILAGGLDTDAPGLYAKDDNLIFAGSEYLGALRSDNGGGSWSLVNNGLINELVWALDISSSNTLYAGGKGGFYKSSNSGGTWQLSNYTFTFEVLSIDATESGSIFIGTWNGVYRSNDNGDSWTYVKQDDYAYFAITENQNGDIFIGNLFSEIYRSTNNGDSWTKTDNGIPDTDNPIYSIASRNDGELYAGTISGVYRSTDNGSSWILTALTSSNMYSIIFNQNGDIFAGGIGPGIQKSTDNGNTWTSINTGVTNIIYELEFNSQGVLFTASDMGVFKSTNEGSSWTQFGDDLADTRILSLAINTNDFIFGGSSGEGVYKSIGPTGIIAANTGEIPSAFTLKQNYPNPFNPTTNIKFEIQSLKYVELKMYDVQGREVAVLVNEELQAGTYEYAFDGSGLSSGTYFYTLTAGDFKETKRMVLLK